MREASEPSNDESGYEEMTIPQLLAKTLPESDDEDEDYNPSQETLRYFDLKMSA